MCDVVNWMLLNPHLVATLCWSFGREKMIMSSAHVLITIRKAQIKIKICLFLSHRRDKEASIIQSDLTLEQMSIIFHLCIQNSKDHKITVVTLRLKIKRKHTCFVVNWNHPLQFRLRLHQQKHTSSAGYTSVPLIPSDPWAPSSPIEPAILRVNKPVCNKWLLDLPDM